MKRKIVKRKRVVKRIRKFSSPEQWGAEFEKLAHREPLPFNMISRVRMEDIADANREACCASEMNITFPPSDGSALRKGEAPPAHYAHGKLEPWNVIKDWKLDYFTGCALKYICRHEHKGNPEQDIQKAIDYLVEYKKTLKEKM